MGIGLGSIFLVLIGATAVLSLGRVKDDWSGYLNVVNLRQQHLSRIRSLMGYGGGIHAFKNYVLRGEQGYFDSYQERADEILATVSAYRSSGSLSPVEEDSLKRVEELTEVYRDAIQRTRQLLKEGKTVEEIDRAVKIDDGPYLEALSALSAELDRATTRRSDALSGLVRKVTVFMTAVIPVSIALFVLFGFFLTRSITGPMGKVAEAAERMADGDLRVALDATSRNETGRMMESLNRMAGNLKRILTQAIEASGQVSTAADQIAEANQNFSQRITEQAASVEETSAAMEEMSASVRQTTDSVKDVNRLSQNTKGLAKSGTSTMEKTIEAMEELTRSSGRIAHISGVIEEIAFQTNLLALNAAVEAARAGEHGKGFGVIASEIRSLAQKTSEFAKEITTVVREGVERTSRAMRFSRELNARLESIVTSVTRAAELMDEIAAAAEEQASGINQVNTAVSQIEQVTQQNASLVEETSASAEELAAQAKELLNLVAFFKVDDAAALRYGVEQRGSPAEGGVVRRPESTEGRPQLVAACGPGRALENDGDFEEF